MIITVIIWQIPLFFLLKEALRGDKAPGAVDILPLAFLCCAGILPRVAELKKAALSISIIRHQVLRLDWTHAPLLLPSCTAPFNPNWQSYVLPLLAAQSIRQAELARGGMHICLLSVLARVPAAFDISEGYIGWELERVSTSAAVPALLL